MDKDLVGKNVMDMRSKMEKLSQPQKMKWIEDNLSHYKMLLEEAKTKSDIDTLLEIQAVVTLLDTIQLDVFQRMTMCWNT